MALKTTLTQPTASGTGTVIATPGMPGAANPVRIVGRNASGAPTTGTFQVGDVVVNTDGTEYVCSAAGTPGTWVQIAALSYGTPVNIDASLTSLSAGSLTTVARADHIHTLSKVPVLIASTTLASATSSLSFSSIPTTYKTLRLLWMMKTNATGGASDVGILRFNNDSGSNYSSFNESTVASQTCIEFTPNASANSTTQFSAGEFYIFGYANATDTPRKTVMIPYVYNTSTTTNATAYRIAGGQWTGSAAITSIQITAAYGTNFQTGCSLQLYGYP